MSTTGSATHAAHARESLRSLAHSTRALDDPDEAYPLLGDLSLAVTSMAHSPHQIARLHDNLGPDGGHRWVIYDEAWRLMQHPALLRRMDAHWRLARHYGIANMLIFHKLTDLDNVGDQGSAARGLASSLLANAETRIAYRLESDQLGATASALGLTRTERSLLPTLGTGQGLWRIKDRSFVVQHQLSQVEFSLYDASRRAVG